MLIAERRDVSFFLKKIPCFLNSSIELRDVTCRFFLKKIPCFLNSSIDMNLATALFTP